MHGQGEASVVSVVCGVGVVMVSPNWARPWWYGQHDAPSHIETAVVSGVTQPATIYPPLDVALQCSNNTELDVASGAQRTVDTRAALLHQ